MARPLKNNAEYFPHDADMRHDPRVKAVRRKFKLEGYAIYVMSIELLTDSDFFQFNTDKRTIEIIAGDFDCDVELLENVLNYCIDLDLFQKSETGILTCKSLENRFEPLISKRERDRTRVIASENAQRRVKESKEEQRKVQESKGETLPAQVLETRNFDWFKNQIDEIWTDQLPTEKKKNLGAAIQNAWEYLSADEKRLKVADSPECKRLVSKAFEYMKNNNNGNIGKYKNGAQSAQFFSGDYSGIGSVLGSDVEL